MIRLIIAFLFLSSFAVAQKEKKGNVFADANDVARMALARQKYLGGKTVSALNSYREIEKTNPRNATVKYYIGLCYFTLKQFANAKESLQKALDLGTDVKPETHLLMGKLYQIDENFDKAIEEFNIYKNTGEKDSEDFEDATVLLSQCENARRMMQSPVPVGVELLGGDINSKYDDKNPCITADGRSLIFTTRRPETTNSPVDIEGDGKYFENIYMAAADSGTVAFTRATGVGKPLNGEAHDACTSISPDGKQIFVYKNDAESKASRGGNVFVSKFSNGKWKTPEPLGKPINSSYWEGGACVSPNGKTYFFSSEREGGFGKSDIWMVERAGKDAWGKTVNLGPEVNSAYDEAGMFLAPDGKTLFFCSNGPGSMGSYDVFKTVNENGKWSKDVNVGFPINSAAINSAAKEGQLSLSADARYGYISSDRKGGMGESDLYRIDLKDYAILEKEGTKRSNGLSILRGTLREGFEGYGLPDVEVSVKNELNGEILNTTTNEAGEYFFTLPGGRYLLTIRGKGYQEIIETVMVGTSDKETVVVEKGYLLKK
jgi:tetratricopeptide (TPR) repeat protein